MARIAGVELAKDKRIEAALPDIFGIGWSLSRRILAEAGISLDKRTRELTDSEVTKIAKIIGRYKVEGELRSQVQTNVARLKEIGTYRGIRHAKNLPVRGQRTRSNARTKRGKRITIGTVRKEIMTRMGPKTTQGQVSSK